MPKPTVCSSTRSLQLSACGGSSRNSTQHRYHAARQKPADLWAGTCLATPMNKSADHVVRSRSNVKRAKDNPRTTKTPASSSPGAAMHRARLQERPSCPAISSSPEAAKGGSARWLHSTLLRMYQCPPCSTAHQQRQASLAYSPMGREGPQSRDSPKPPCSSPPLPDCVPPPLSLPRAPACSLSASRHRVSALPGLMCSSVPPGEREDKMRFPRARGIR